MSQYTKGQTVTINVPEDSAYFAVTEGTYIEAMDDGDGHIVSVRDPSTQSSQATWFSDEEVSA